jgi:hypothetical protein
MTSKTDNKYRVSGKIIGTLEGDTLVKKGKQVMLMRIFDGFGIPVTVFDDERVRYIEVHYKNKVYRVFTGEYRRHGIPFHREPYEAQLVLPRRYFSDGAQESLWEA